ncbi:MAG: ExbD/TolR family protein [Phycisphaerales bacterium]
MPKRRGPVRVHANLTPMIDVTFLLIVFFVLVSQIVETEHVDMDLPVLIDPSTEPPGEDARAVVNVVPGIGGDVLAYRLGSTRYPADDAGRAALTAALATRIAGNPQLRLNLRADRDSHYELVRPVLEAVAEATRRVPGAAPRVHLVVIPEDGP